MSVWEGTAALRVRVVDADVEPLVVEVVDRLQRLEPELVAVRRRASFTARTTSSTTPSRARRYPQHRWRLPRACATSSSQSAREILTGRRLVCGPCTAPSPGAARSAARGARAGLMRAATPRRPAVRGPARGRGCSARSWRGARRHRGLGGDRRGAAADAPRYARVSASARSTTPSAWASWCASSARSPKTRPDEDYVLLFRA